MERKIVVELHGIEVDGMNHGLGLLRIRDLIGEVPPDI